MFAPYSDNKSLGAFILIDTQTNNTAGVGFIL
jgi:sulfate adenylyltransferase subunit 1 (EFTu-like GTPase family)